MKYLIEELPTRTISDSLTGQIISEIDLEPQSSDIQPVTFAQSVVVDSLDSLELDSVESSNLDNNSHRNNIIIPDLAEIAVLPITSEDLIYHIYLESDSRELELFNLDNIAREDSSIVTELAQNDIRSTNSAGFTNNTYIDGILWGGNSWNTSISKEIDYSFLNSSTADFAYNWTTAEKVAMVKALDTWAAVADITFVDAGDNNLNATLGFYSVDDSKLDDHLGSFSPPGTSNEGIGYFNWEGTGWDYINGNQQGDYGFVTMIHELGHGLGLAHPHDDGGGSSIYKGVTSALNDTGDFDLNQGIYTTMSYNDGLVATGKDPGTWDYGYQGTPMAFDIAAVQYLYGANMTYNTGDDTYFLPTVNASGTFFSSIWDTGGTDKISGSGASTGVTINLNDATLNSSDGTGAGGYLSSVSGIFGGFTIANDVIIENADGSDFNDEIIGNEFDNNLFGDDGKDTLVGGSGDDILTGGSGNDRLIGYEDGIEYDVFSGGEGVDTFVLGNSSKVFYQGDGYVSITDFNWQFDYIEVRGDSSQYSLGFGNWIGSSAQDTAIFYSGDAIAVVKDYTNVSITRDFLFV